MINNEIMKRKIFLVITVVMFIIELIFLVLVLKGVSRRCFSFMAFTSFMFIMLTSCIGVKD